MTTLQLGSNGPDVVTLQQTLKERGFDPGNIDGQFGRGTEAAVLAFQKSERLVSDGVARPAHACDVGIGGTGGCRERDPRRDRHGGIRNVSPHTDRQQ
ncbi:MAG: hypothetical protein OJF47_000244 [Nitrospira sp.]|jgi:peptidoglycan hydrolase-like protein with peptidoglycan-binding domain|nr:MAG: hypothetical protein OJF47_000244 [Nitrospira sp.]